MNLGRLIARVTIGGLFAGHGSQKLFGWFGGPGLQGTSQMMDKLELRPGRRNAAAVGVAETAAGAMLALGALTPLAASLVTGSMITAIRKVHFSNGPWATNGGYEYNVALIAAAVALVDCGPGSPSVDRALSIEASGSKWALAALAAGAAGSGLVIEAGRRVAEQQSEQASADAEEPKHPTGRFSRELEEIERELIGATI